MKTKTFERTPTFAAVVLVVLVVAACAIRLRGDDEQTNPPAPADLTFIPLPPKLTECRSVTNEENGALSECLRAWDENRRQFIGRKAPAPSGTGAAQAGSSLFVAPKDESRLPSGYPSIQPTDKE
jgi:conjugative transfer region protein TrbK